MDGTPTIWGVVSVNVIEGKQITGYEMTQQELNGELI